MKENPACFCLPHPYDWIAAGVAFVLAYLVFLLIWLILRLAFKKSQLGSKIVSRVQTPFFFFMMLVAGFTSTILVDLGESLEPLIDKVLLVLLIIDLGWISSRIVGALFHRALEKLEEHIQTDVGRRGSYTQIIFLKRFVMSVILFLSLSAILLLFPLIRNVGVGLLGSAGVVGIVIGMAARPLFLNLIASFQIAITKTIKIGDRIFVNSQYGVVEKINHTHVVLRSWDLKRLIYPISEFIDKPFENWDMESPELIGTVMLYCDYTVPIEKLREKFHALIKASPLWNGKVAKLHVTNLSDHSLEVRLIMTARQGSDNFELRCFIRQKMIEYVQQEFPRSLPAARYKNEVVS